MPRVNRTITTFIGGEVSQKYYARVDSDIFQRSVAKALNFIVMPQGGARFRNGTRLVHHTRFGLKAILIPFQYSDSQAYLIEMTNQAMRFYKDGQVITRPSKAITAITKANPAQVTVTGHGLTTGREVYLEGIQGMTELNNRFFNITFVDANNFTLSHPVTGTNENSTNYTTYTSGGTSSQVLEVPTPYTVDSLPDLRWDQSGDYMYVTSRQYEQRRITRTAHTLWSIGTFARTSDFVADARDYPRACCFDSAGRQIYAGTADNPETMFGSMTPNSSGNRYENFTVGTGASDAFIYTASPVLNRPDVIQWIANVNKKIIIGAFSSIREGRGANDDESMSPLGVDIRPISNYGAENAVPVTLGDSLFYIQRTGKKIRSIDYSLAAQGYVNRDRTIMADHILKSGALNLVQCQGGPDLLWVSRNDGKLAALTTYMGVDDVSGWSRHYTAGHHVNDNGIVVPFARVLNVGRMARPGNDDQLWLVVERLSVNKDRIKNITAINRTTATLTANSHGFGVGEIVLINSVVGTTELNGNYYKITATTTNTFTLDVDISGFTAYSSGGIAGATFTNRTIEYVVDEPDYPDRSDFYSDLPEDETESDAVIAEDDTKFLNALYEAQKSSVHLDMSAEYDGRALGANTVKLNVALAPVNAKTIASVTQANPGVFTTSTAHGFISGDWVEFTGMLGMTAFNGLCLPVVVTSSTQFNLGINTSALPAYTASSGTVTRRGVGIPVLSPPSVQPIVIHTATAHGLTAGARIYLSGINGTEELNNNYYLVGSVINTNAITLLIDNTNTQVTTGTALTQYTSGGVINQFGVSVTPGQAAVGTGITFTSDFAIFTASMVGRQIVKAYDENGNGGGIATITGYTNSTTVTCTINSAFDNKQAIPGGKWYLTANTITGLHHLAGEEVTLVGDGGMLPPQVVPGTGRITLPNQVGRLIAGKRYKGIMETLNLDAGGVTGSAQAKKRNCYKAMIRFLNSLGSYFGSLGTFFGATQYKKERIQFDPDWDLLGRPTPLYTGNLGVTFSDNWEDKEKKVLVMHDVPMPCTILSMDVFMNVSDED